MHHGSPATQGSGPEQFTVRIVFETSSFDELKGVFDGSFDLCGVTATINRENHFYLLRATGFNTAKQAERFARVIQCAMIALSAGKGLTLWMQPVSPVERDEVPTNVQLRDAFAEQNHPEWRRRVDGSVTDGGVWPHQSCILAEHDRIWEYPVLWAKPRRELTGAALQNAVTEANSKRNIDATVGDKRLTAATKFLNLANGEPNREVGFVLFATVLETLADEDGQGGVGKLVAQCRSANGESNDDNEGQELYRIRSKLLHKGVPQLDGKALSWNEFSERYWRIRTLASQAVMLRLDDLSR